MKRLLTFWVLILLMGCSTESLQIQTSFPFTLTTDPLPTQLKKGAPLDIPLTITPERLTTQSQYRIKWQTLNTLSGQLQVGKFLLDANVFTSLTELSQTVTFLPTDVGTYSLNLIIVDQSGNSQQLPVTFTVTNL